MYCSNYNIVLKMFCVDYTGVATSGLEYASAKSFYQKIPGSSVQTYEYYKANCTSNLIMLTLC